MDDDDEDDSVFHIQQTKAGHNVNTETKRERDEEEVRPIWDWDS
ncbi:unnamed protein product, partial [Musa hybrid cultivar]